MKKLISLILAMICVLCFAGCDATDATDDTKANETEHIHQWQDVSGEHARICTECNEKQLKPEACSFVNEDCEQPMICSVCGAISDEPTGQHDWGGEHTTSDCWSVTFTKRCTKCNVGEEVHADFAWPDHIWDIETQDDFMTAYACTRCKKTYVVAGEITSFSYADVLAEHPIGEPGVKQENFIFDIDIEMASVTDAITMAEFHLTVQYDTVAVSFDEASGVWGVVFYTSDVDGGCQSVYVNNADLTCYIVYGE